MPTQHFLSRVMTLTWMTWKWKTRFQRWVWYFYYLLGDCAILKYLLLQLIAFTRDLLFTIETDNSVLAYVPDILQPPWWEEDSTTNEQLSHV